MARTKRKGGWRSDIGSWLSQNPIQLRVELLMLVFLPEAKANDGPFSQRSARFMIFHASLLVTTWFCEIPMKRWARLARNSPLSDS